MDCLVLINPQKMVPHGTRRNYPLKIKEQKYKENCKTITALSQLKTPLIMASLVLTRTGSKNKNAKDYLRYEYQIYGPHCKVM